MQIIKKTYHQFYSGIPAVCDTPLPVHSNMFLRIFYTSEVGKIHASKAV